MNIKRDFKCPLGVIMLLEAFLLLGLNAVLFLILYNDDSVRFPFFLLQLIALAIVGVSFGSTIRFRHILRRAEDENQLNLMQLEQAQKIIESLYIQRHDFKNQISLIKTWAELGRTKEILKYLEEESPIIMELDGFDYIHCPVLQALLLMINTKCRELKIRFSLDTTTSLDDFSFPWVKVYHIFSNILTNAVEAVSTGELKENSDVPEIQMAIWDNDELYHFVVWTPTILPQDDTKIVFKTGYSTKRSPGHGMGLSIVSKMVRELSGTVWAETSSASGTEFHVALPKPHWNLEKELGGFGKRTLLGWDKSKKHTLPLT